MEPVSETMIFLEISYTGKKGRALATYEEENYNIRCCLFIYLFLLFVHDSLSTIKFKSQSNSEVEPVNKMWHIKWKDRFHSGIWL